MAIINEMGMLSQPLNNQPIVGQIGPDGKPITFLDALFGVRPPMNPNPFNVPNPLIPSRIMSNLSNVLGEQTAPMQPEQNFNLMNTFRNAFGMPTQTTSMVDGEQITSVDRTNTLPTNTLPTDQQIENEVAESGMNPALLQAALSGLLNENPQQPMPPANIQGAFMRGQQIPLQSMTRFYGGVLSG